MGANKPISVNTEEVDRMMDKLMDEIEINLSQNNSNPPLDGQREMWSESSRRALRFALVITVLILLIVTAGYYVQPVSEETLAVEKAVSASTPVILEQPTVITVPPTTQPEVEIQTVEVPVLISSADAPIVETELVTVNESTEAISVPILTPETVNQTDLELTTAEVPEGVTENQFAEMERTVSQPQVEQTVAVATPVVSAPTYSARIVQVPAPSFVGEVTSYLPVESSVPEPLVWWKRLLEGTSYTVRDQTVAYGEARYFIEIGESFAHRETITLALIVPRVDDVRDIAIADETSLSDEEVRDRLITEACQNTDNLRTIMDRAKVDLATEAGDYELVLTWYTHRGERVAQDIGDAELISYCQLG